MSMVLEFIGLSPAGLNGIPAEDPAKDAAARPSGELVMDLVRRDVRPSRIVTREALENGIAVGRGDGRLDERRPAPARHRPRVRDPARHRRVRGRSPTGRRSSPTCSPAGASSASDLYDAGGVGARHARAAQAAGPAPRRRGRRSTAGRSPRSPRPRRETPGQQVVVPIERAAQADRRPGDPARVARARTAASSSSPATSVGCTAARPASSSRRPTAMPPSATGGSCAGDVVVIRNEGPVGGPGMQEMLSVTAALVGEGLGDTVALLTDGRFSRRHPRPDDRPRRARRPRSAARSRSSTKATRSSSTSIARRSTWRSRPTRSPRRLRATGRRRPRATRGGVMAKYAALVDSASRGAVTTGAPDDRRACGDADRVTRPRPGASRSGSRPRRRASTGRRSMRPGRGSASTTCSTASG